MLVIFVGPPGAGKGTQAKLCSDEFGVYHLSTGEAFRNAAGSDSEVGKKLSAVLASGDLVSDELTLEVVKQALPAEGACILDGFPRNLSQAQMLSDLAGDRVCGVVYFNAPSEVTLSRIKARRAESGRSDDADDVALKRLNVYNEMTAPLLSYYSEKKLLDEVDGVGSVEDVYGRLRKVFARYLLRLT